MSYVVTRLDEKTFTQYRIKNKICSKFFRKIENIIKLMIKLFENSNHKRIVKRNFKNLKQKSIQLFNDFYHKFLRLFNEFNFSKKNFIDELLNKLNARMKRARINDIKNFYTLNDVQKKFQKLNNNLSRHDKKTREYNFFLKSSNSFQLKFLTLRSLLQSMFTKVKLKTFSSMFIEARLQILSSLKTKRKK